jgi:hypothetical protein
VHVKLLGWIKSAVEFIKLPAGLQQAEASPDAPPHKVDSQSVTQDHGPGAIETLPDNRISAEPEIRASPESEPRVRAEPEGLPSQEEIDRRRGIVREFFNDYWSSADEKPTSFADRLDRAEGYINERVAAGGETWRLGPATRKQLGLPASRKK